MSVRNEYDLIPATQWITVMRPLMDEGNLIQIVPKGSSMFPFLSGGRDTAFIASAKGHALRRGDIVLYPRQDKKYLYLHRIYRIGDEGYYMLGDNSTEVEPPLPREDIYGVVVKMIRKSGEISCENKRYRLLAWMWMLLRPLRPAVIAVWSTAKKMFRKQA